MDTLCNHLLLLFPRDRNYKNFESHLHLMMLLNKYPLLRQAGLKKNILKDYCSLIKILKLPVIIELKNSYIFPSKRGNGGIRRSSKQF